MYWPPSQGYLNHTLLISGSSVIILTKLAIMIAKLIVGLLLSVLVEDIACLTEAEKMIILDAHNRFRGIVSPPAADMQKMVRGYTSARTKLLLLLLFYRNGMMNLLKWPRSMHIYVTTDLTLIGCQNKASLPLWERTLLPALIQIPTMICLSRVGTMNSRISIMLVAHV